MYYGDGSAIEDSVKGQVRTSKSMQGKPANLRIGSLFVALRPIPEAPTMTSPLFATPADWDDAAGWETYHAGLYPRGPFRDARSWLEEMLTVIGRNFVALMFDRNHRV